MEIKTKRPSIHDEEIFNKWCIVAAEIVNKAKGYADINESIEDCKQVLEYAYNDDGYQLAKRFEDKRYTITTILVEELDTLSWEADDIIKDATKKWVKENDIKLEQKVGDKVIFDAYKKNNEEGEIMKLYPETAQYGVWSESSNNPKGSSHYLINYEKIKK